MGCPEDFQRDCGTDGGHWLRVGVLRMSQGLPVGLWDRRDRTLGQLLRVEVLGMYQGLPVGLWDRRDTRTDRTLGQTGGTLGQLPKHGNS